MAEVKMEEVELKEIQCPHCLGYILVSVGMTVQAIEKVKGEKPSG